MIWSIISGFIIGITSSLHCVAMCGPLVLVVPTSTKGLKKTVPDILIYHAGRIGFYALLGLIGGLVGVSLFLFIPLQWISISIGILMLIMAWFSLGNTMPFQQSLTGFISRKLSHLYLKLKDDPNKSLLLGTGFLNGMLPCGLVYFGLLNAIASASTLGSIFCMIAFGLGTLPSLFFFSLYTNTVKKRIAFQKAIPYFLNIAALLMILRGLNLGIPYISPKIEVIQNNGHSQPKMECCDENTTCTKYK
jgi:sulfite exporter TauE/SafE